MHIDHDLLLNTDIAESIQGHVSPSIKQVFRTLYAAPFSLEKLKIGGYEFLQVDQFGNHYHKMRAVLFDGEMYDSDQYIKPSMMMHHSGGHADYEDKVAKQKLRITESLLQALRQEGAVRLVRANLEIMKGKQAGNAPVAIETKDMNHQANVLEDSLTAGIEAIKKANGEAVSPEPINNPVFDPIKGKATLPVEKAITVPVVKPEPLVTLDTVWPKKELTTTAKLTKPKKQ